MQPKHTDLKRFFRSRTVGGLCAVIIAAATFDVLSWRATDSPEEHRHILIALASETVVVAAASLLALVLLGYAEDKSREAELTDVVVEPLREALASMDKSVFTGIHEIPWATLFEGTTEIWLVVQGWDGWQKKVATHLRPFLEQGGKIHVILPKLPDEARKDDPLHELLRHIALRMNRRTGEVRAEIQKTDSGLREAVAAVVGEAHVAEHLTIAYTTRMNWFCGIAFKPGRLLLSLYQHQSFTDIAAIDSPSFVVRTDVHPDLGRWFESEWRHMLTQSEGHRAPRG